MAPSVCIPLQMHCIYSIAAEFDRFCIAYSSTHSNIPKHHFEFLQRKYTKDLLATLKSAKSLKNEHLDFIINRYTKEFDINQFEGCDWKCIEEKLNNVGDVIVDLKLSSNAEWNSLREKSCSVGKNIDDLNWWKFPNLEELDLSGSRVCDDTLINIGRCCPLLKALDVSDCTKLTNQGFVGLFDSADEKRNFICPYLYLQTLNVFNTHVNGDGISYILQNIGKLEILKYKKVPKVLYKMHQKDLENNCLSGVKKYNLTYLCFHDTYKSVTDVLFVCSILCPRVKSLTIHNDLTSYDLNLCSKFCELEYVTLSGVSPYMFSINSFVVNRGMHLTYIRLDDFSISISVLAKSCPKVKELNLFCTFETADEWRISTLKFLHTLTLYHAVFSDENTLKSTISILTASPKLEILRLSSCHFCDQIDRDDLLRSMNNLKELDIKYSDIEVPFVRSILLSCSGLQYLTIEVCKNILGEQYDYLLGLIHEMKSTVKLSWSEGNDSSDSEDEDSVFDKSDSDDEHNDFGNI